MDRGRVKTRATQARATPSSPSSSGIAGKRRRLDTFDHMQAPAEDGFTLVAYLANNDHSLVGQKASISFTV